MKREVEGGALGARPRVRLLPLDERKSILPLEIILRRGDQSETNEAGTYAYISSRLAALIYANSTKWYRPTNIAAAYCA